MSRRCDTIKPGFTIEELLADLSEPQGHVEGYHTLNEWAAQLNIGEDRMRRLLVAAKAQGKLLIVREQREAIDGRMMPIPVYAFQIDR